MATIQNSHKMPSKTITLNGYKALLGQLQRHINQTQNSIAEIVTRQKVVMSWKIGKSVALHLLENTEAGYGDHLFEQLEIDTRISKSVLYKMLSFYQSYPKLPKDDKKLNWSHYRILSGVKTAQERNYLEDLTRENNWDADTLQAEVKQSKISQIRAKALAVDRVEPKKIYPKRGQLFCYNLKQLEGSDKIYLDCGFNVFREVEEALPAALLKQLKSGDQVVQSSKKNGEYSFAKTEDNSARKLNAYQARLERVVDGDTLHVAIDLGFKFVHREILRLRGINAPEMSTEAGKKSAVALKYILKDVKFLILKTTATDIYGRYVVDVFFAEGEEDSQKVAESGIYLNQLLLDKKLAVLF